jgi:hypothetical protein
MSYLTVATRRQGGVQAASCLSHVKYRRSARMIHREVDVVSCPMASERSRDDSTTTPVQKHHRQVLRSLHFLANAQEIALALQQSRCRRFVREVERAFRACHAVWTLLEEVIRAVAMAEIVELPRLGDGPALANRLLIDEYFDRPDVLGKITSIDIRLCQLGRGDLDVVPRASGELWPSHSWSSKRVIGSLALKSCETMVERALWLVILPRTSLIGIPAFRHSIGMIEPSR